MLEYTIQIGISDVGKTNKMKLGSILDKLQNGSFFQLNTEKLLMDYFDTNNIGMYLIYRQLNIKKFPIYGEFVTIKSWISGCDKLFGYRNTIMLDADGNIGVTSFSQASFIDLKENKMIRLPEEIIKKILTEPPFDKKPLSRKIAIPDKIIKKHEPIRIQEHHLDFNQHMNNARYMDIAESSLPNNFFYTKMNVEYKKPAKLGDLFIPITYQRDTGEIVIVFINPNNETYAIVEFI